ncbi:MAG: L,D-transpeptidase [Candidatus Dormibacteraeota bacterium]|nr:L,D-transpeptidase [Candidatus Dormibacteraeota bacterium]
MLTASLRLVRHNAMRIAIVIATFAAVGAVIVLQQVREVNAIQGYEAARQQVLAEQAHAQTLGLEPSELSDLQRQELTTAAEAPPTATAPFNESRIDFFSNAASQEVQIKDLLQSREQQIVSQAKASAEAAIAKLATDLATAKKDGVEDQLLTEFQALPSRAQEQLGAASNARAYRGIAQQLKAPLTKLSLEIAQQEATNALIGQYAAQVAAQDHGDATLARNSANSALSAVQADLGTARIFSMDVSVIDSRVQKLATQLSAATAVTELEQVAGGLQVSDKVLVQAMQTNLPDKAITISLKEQVVRAYEHGTVVFHTLATTGRPGLETDPGSFKVYAKNSPWTMHSPWPKGSPYWYPDSKVKMVMWFNGGDGIHDAYWRAYYGPGTQYQHYDPFGENTGTHGCVNVPYSSEVWLWNWTPIGTPVIVY